jgi:hypothetical protein
MFPPSVTRFFSAFSAAQDFWHNPCMALGNDLQITRVTRAYTLSFLIMICCIPSPAQQPATVTFTLDFPNSEPDHYVISVSSDGHATYESNGKLSPDAQADSSRLDFSLSAATRARIFDLAKRAHYFQGVLDSKKRNLASTGSKTLTYKDAQRSTEATYNYSAIPAVQELTQVFQNLSATLEFGRRLEYFHHYQKLALDDELKRMEETARENGLVELAAVSPILQQIANDNSVINPVRARAQRLLEQTKTAR